MLSMSQLLGGGGPGMRRDRLGPCDDLGPPALGTGGGGCGRSRTALSEGGIDAALFVEGGERASLLICRRRDSRMRSLTERWLESF